MKSNRTGAFLWIDFSKTFDFISHDYLLILLEHIGFSESPTNAIRNMIRQVTTRILFNKFISTTSISVMRGFRQGDPISGYLFNIALEVLNYMVMFELSPSLLKVFDSTIPSLMYCDDTVLCFQNSSVILSALEILDNIARISQIHI
eukprot:TRINITY_DN4425_c0_g4_i4.p1 TRINITY_DN4425_c0_g4~~TRINITY_DN4425_c0_g4_i4.p1  ORF type:complete len:147 (-),score=9.34 TRINITY_DN4425_c0_g4_i4:285-725(-)